MDRKIIKCNTCNGFGMWAMGDPSPMGYIDGQDGMPTIPCPECGSNKNPYNGFETDDKVVEKKPQKTIKVEVFEKDTYYDIAKRFAESFGDPDIIDGMWLYTEEKYKEARKLVALKNKK